MQFEGAGQHVTLVRQASCCWRCCSWLYTNPHCNAKQPHSTTTTHLQGASQDVSIVRQACCERRAIVEDVLRLALTAAQLLLKSIKAVPQGEDLFLLGWEAVRQSLKSVTLLVWWRLGEK